jgi:cysteine-rich repeat protein
VNVTLLRSVNVYGNLTILVKTVEVAGATPTSYAPTSKNVTFSSQQTQSFVTIPLLLDPSPFSAPSSFISLELVNATGGALGPVSAATVTVHNVHLPPPLPPSLRSRQPRQLEVVWLPKDVLPWVVPLPSPVHSTATSVEQAGISSWAVEIRQLNTSVADNWTAWMPSATIAVTPVQNTALLALALTHTVSGLAPFTEYQFRLAASNQVTGRSSWSSPSLTFATLPLCGDGVRQGSEVCDDGNMVTGDGCDSSCTVEIGWACGRVGTGGEVDTCSEGCGNGYVSVSEGCDDGGLQGGDGCSASCSVEPGWLCSRPSVNSSAPACVCATVCGDGVLAGVEACDAGVGQGTSAAPVGSAGCSPTCTVVPGYTCALGATPASTAASAAAAGSLVAKGSTCQQCGNGVLEGTEVCEDGNSAAGDGCSPSCTVELGWVCSPSQANKAQVEAT